MQKTDTVNDFPAIPLLEYRPYDQFREFYIYQEPALLTAIHRRDRNQTVHIINHILLHIYSAGQEQNELLKGLLLELVVMISRSAVEAGASQSDVLSMNFQRLTELAGIRDDEQLARWLRSMLEHIFDVIEKQPNFTPPLLFSKALRYIRENLHREVTRDETARHVGISPSHFSHLLRKRTGKSFTELLRQSRVDLAAQLMTNTERTLADIAASCGFCDQSYFTRVFRQIRGISPNEFRKTAEKSSTYLPKKPT